MKFERARSSEHKTDRQNEIIKACISIYDEKGYEGVSFSNIAEKTSFTRPSIYNYYKTKDEILVDVLNLEMLHFTQNISLLSEKYNNMDKRTFCREMTLLLINSSRFLELSSILFTILEKNCSILKIIKLKKVTYRLFQSFYKIVDKFFPTVNREIKDFFGKSVFSYVLGLYPVANRSDDQLKAIELSGIDYQPPDFEELCYKGIMLLMSDF